jgi:ABC-type glycerol-3-phosphate transport system substrate-binding protein
MKKTLLGLFLLVLVATLAACGAEQGEYIWVYDDAEISFDDLKKLQ